MNSLKRLDENELPPKEEFSSNDDYEHAKKVWKHFKINTFRDYHDLYSQDNVLLLTDVFESFRDVCIKNYELDPAWYHAAHGLAWDAALKKTKVNLELLTNQDMLLMIEKGIRGGVSMISNR